MAVTPRAPRAPYSLDPVEFPLPALAALAGRAPLGGSREVVLACLAVARLVADRLDPRLDLSPEDWSSRARGARHWLGTAAVPAGVRKALTELAERTVRADPGALREAIAAVMAVTADHLDGAARLELGRLAQTVAE